jgi:hypothetical protein
LTSAIACAVCGASAWWPIRRAAAQPGIEDRQIDRRRRVGGNQLGGESRRITQIESLGDGGRAQGAALTGDLVQPRLIPAPQQKRDIAARIEARQSGADTAGCAGDQDGSRRHESRVRTAEMRQFLLSNSRLGGYGAALFAGKPGPLSASVEIVPVQTKRQWRDFHHLPFAIYRDDPNWVPPLLLERKFHFDPKHNPFFQHARAAFFLAYRDGVPVGRITAQIDQLHLERYQDATGHFGFIEAVDDPEVFAALLDAAEGWLRGQGMKRAVGPVSFSLWDQPGLLVEGFDTPPYVMMNHHLPYYADRIAAQGYQKAEDLIAYRYGPDASTKTWDKLMARAMRGGEITLRNIHMDKRFRDEVAMLLDIINDAWSDNWGYVP